MIQNFTKQGAFVLSSENKMPRCTNPRHGDFDSD